jgi:hypothetical protein
MAASQHWHVFTCISHANAAECDSLPLVLYPKSKDESSLAIASDWRGLADTDAEYILGQMPFCDKCRGFFICEVRIALRAGYGYSPPNCNHASTD